MSAMSTPYSNLNCVELSSDTLSLLVTQSVGPRVIGLRYRGGENLFAELPDLKTDTPAGVYHFYGGHRLWRAPEELSLTYLPDDEPVEITKTGPGLQIVQPTDPTGLQKSIAIILQDSSVILHHTLTNRSSTPVTCAPWTITQLKPGGVAILPQSTETTGFLPNRQMALWPYTDVRNPHLVFGNRYISVQANMSDGALKVGFPNPRGWLAYWREGILFVKKTAFDPQADYLDFGSSSECYCCDTFIELETLGGVKTLREGDSVSHTETWEVYEDIKKPEDEDSADALVKKLGLA